MTLPTWVQYVDALGPLLALIAGLTAAAIAYRTYRHRRTQDRKEEWWRRTQWASDHAMSDDELRRTVGITVLAQQAASALADTEDQQVLDAVADHVLQARAARLGEPIPWAVPNGGDYDESPAGEEDAR